MDGGGGVAYGGPIVQAQIVETVRRSDERGKEYTTYVVRCISGRDQWQLDKRYKDFRSLRQSLINSGAAPLKRIKFPRKTITRSSNEKTAAKRAEPLQQWLSVVVSNYGTIPELSPIVLEFLGHERPDMRRLSVGSQVHFDPDPKLLVGTWRASGYNRLADAGAATSNAGNEEEVFWLRLKEDGETLYGGENRQNDDGGFTLEDIQVYTDEYGLAKLKFVQVYNDAQSTRTGWDSYIDQAHIELGNGTWVAMSGVHMNKQLGTFSAQKILQDPTPGRFRVISQDGVLVRAGIAQSSDPVTKLDMGAEVQVIEVQRRDDDVVRLCFMQAGLPLAVPDGSPPASTSGTEQLWVSERHSASGVLLLERVDEEEEEEEDEEESADTVDVTIVASVDSNLISQEHNLQLTAWQSVDELKKQVIGEIPALASATDLKWEYWDADFEEYVGLSYDDDELTPMRIKVEGKKMATCKIMAYFETVGSEGAVKVSMNNPTTVEELEAKLRAHQQATRMPEVPVNIHPVSGTGKSNWQVGAAFKPSDTIQGEMLKIVVMAEGQTEGVPPQQAVSERTPPETDPPTSQPDLDPIPSQPEPEPIPSQPEPEPIPAQPEPEPKLTLKVLVDATAISNETSTRVINGVTVSSLAELRDKLMAGIEKATIEAEKVEIYQGENKLEDLESLRSKPSVKLTLRPAAEPEILEPEPSSLSQVTAPGSGPETVQASKNAEPPRPSRWKRCCSPAATAAASAATSTPAAVQPESDEQ